jgi:hypothetical protein
LFLDVASLRQVIQETTQPQFDALRRQQAEDFAKLHLSAWETPLTVTPPLSTCMTMRPHALHIN